MKVIVDSDGGIDDATAISWLCQNPDVELVAVTAVGGSVPARQAALNLRLILETAGAGDVPVFVGLDPGGPAPDTQPPIRIHGHDGLADLPRRDLKRPPEDSMSGPRAIAELSNAETSLLALGPMTNIAAALTTSGLTSQETALTFMGGSARAGGNARPSAEANIAHDPRAADITLRSAWSRPPVMVGLDVTHAATMTSREFATLALRRTAVAEFLCPRLAFYRGYAGMLCAPGETPCHDLLTAMVCVDPRLVSSEPLYLEVDTGGSSAWGMTVVDMRPVVKRAHAAPADLDDGNSSGGGALVDVALGVDVERFRREVRDFFGGVLVNSKGTN